MAERHASTDKSDTEKDTETAEEAGTSQSHSRQKKEHMTNIKLTDSDEEAIVSRCARPGLSHNGYVTASPCNPSQFRPQKR